MDAFLIQKLGQNPFSFFRWLPFSEQDFSYTSPNFQIESIVFFRLIFRRSHLVLLTSISRSWPLVAHPCFKFQGESRLSIASHADDLDHNAVMIITNLYQQTIKSYFKPHASYTENLEKKENIVAVTNVRFIR